MLPRWVEFCLCAGYTSFLITEGRFFSAWHTQDTGGQFHLLSHSKVFGFGDSEA